MALMAHVVDLHHISHKFHTRAHPIIGTPGALAAGHIALVLTPIHTAIQMVPQIPPQLARHPLFKNLPQLWRLFLLPCVRSRTPQLLRKPTQTVSL